MEVHMPPSILAGRLCRMTCQVRLAFIAQRFYTCLAIFDQFCHHRRVEYRAF